MLSASKMEVFVLPFQSVSLSLFTLARTSGTMLNKTRNHGHLCLPPSLRGKAICPLLL